jgi:hypothetical protein
MYRRAVLGTFIAGWTTLFAGCTASRVDGEVVSNETPLALSHEYSTQATFSGTRVVVDVTAENDGSEPITPEVPFPRVVCAFFDDAGETLYRSGIKLTQPVDIGETVTLEFPLAVEVDEVTRYELRSEWIEG